MTHPILVVDDDPGMCELLADGLAGHGYDVTFVTDASEALRRSEQDSFEAVVTDVSLRGMDGLELCKALVTALPDVPVIVMTGFGSMDTAVRALRAGAYDFLTKPLDVDVVAYSLQRALGHRGLKVEVTELRRAVEEQRGFGDIVGASPSMQVVYDVIARAAPSEATVLVTGETGTGKELVARMLHRRSRRKSGPFVAINCAAVPETLLESELFGHARGAFTDARNARPGLFVQAHGGTLFLDEVGDMPLPVQPKLLRALQERTVRPVGADREVPVDVRVIAATHSDLESRVEERLFREDLFYRINVIHIAMPPLRARGGDVMLLADHFLRYQTSRAGKHVEGFGDLAREKLLAYNWPGNVRELQNCVERAVALTSGTAIEPADLPEKIRDYRSSHIVVSGSDPSELVSLQEVERRYILRVIEAVGGNKTQAAHILGLDRKTLYRKLEQYRAS
jgi:two-component system response regulator AtoC